MKEFPAVARSGFAQAKVDEAMGAVNNVMREVCDNAILLHSIVAGGLHHWMVHASRSFSGFAVDDQVLRDMFHYFAAQADSDPKKKLDELLKAANN